MATGAPRIPAQVGQTGTPGDEDSLRKGAHATPRGNHAAMLKRTGIEPLIAPLAETNRAVVRPAFTPRRTSRQDDERPATRGYEGHGSPTAARQRLCNPVADRFAALVHTRVNRAHRSTGVQWRVASAFVADRAVSETLLHGLPADR